MARRVTAHDIAQAGSISRFVEQMIDFVRAGDMETKEYGAGVLRSLTEHNAQHAGADQKGKMKTVTSEMVSSGLAIDTGMATSTPLDNISMIAKAHGIKPLVQMLKDSSSIAQRDACGTLANLARGRPENQDSIVACGGVKPLAAILRGGDAGTQEQAAAALSSVSQNLAQQKSIIEAGAIPPLVHMCRGNMVRYASSTQTGCCRSHAC